MPTDADELERVNGHVRQLAAELLDQELAECDAVHRENWYGATHGDIKALDRVLKAMDKRARLLGLYQQPRRARRR